MKLYATIKSERAQKSQGGNEYLDIDILVGSTARPLSLARLTVRPSSTLGPYKDRNGYALYDEKDTLLAYRIDETKPARIYIANEKPPEHPAL